VPVLGILVVHGVMRERRLEDVVARTPWWVTAGAVGLMLAAIMISQGSSNAFIYFQF
jgi:alginate O-acetyltransferase complex protein AlgI